jgi:hypothetical protein
MKRIQCLQATLKICQNAHRHRAHMARQPDMIVASNNHQIAKQIEALNSAEKQMLESQVKLQLARERRRCNARSATYDVNRHIRLYIMEKTLQCPS